MKLFRIAAALCLPFTLAGADISGAWLVTGSAIGFPVTTACSIRQQDRILTGDCLSNKTGPTKLTGNLEGQKITFHYDFRFEGESMTIAYDGVVESPTGMRGSMEVMSPGPNNTRISAKG